jgi:hypothetical protein
LTWRQSAGGKAFDYWDAKGVRRLKTFTRKKHAEAFADIDRAKAAH